MPELPEVETTANGLRRAVVGLRVTDVWSDYDSAYHKGADNIKDPRYFNWFKGQIIGSKIISVERKAKNILINLNNGKTILVHMKMTGHLLYGEYAEIGSPLHAVEPYNRRKLRRSDLLTSPVWTPISPESLKDPFNRHVHFVISFDNGKRLALSDARKFAKVTLLTTKEAHQSDHLNEIGPEPLGNEFTFNVFTDRLRLRLNGRIKQVLTDQKIVAGIGNIYSDEVLWRAGIHPLERVRNIPATKARILFKAIKQTLSRGIDLGGDSMSDYRNIHGKKGKFQEHHRAYRRTGLKCGKPGCSGTIRRIVVGSRSAHYCDRHQNLSRNL